MTISLIKRTTIPDPILLSYPRKSEYAEHNPATQMVNLFVANHISVGKRRVS